MKHLMNLFEECKDIRIRISIEDSKITINNLSDFGYHTPIDYRILYDPMELPNILFMIIRIRNEKMLQDQAVRELLLEYII